MNMDITRTLPEECIANIISGTSPRDACRLSLVSRAFKSIATSNLVWGRFLPPDCQEIISSSSSSSSLNMLTKKNLYFHLCDNPILIGNSNNMSFQIDKLSGKKCLMLAARELSIIWGSGDTPHYWEWISSTQSPVLPKSRFSEVACLRKVCWLDIKGRIETKILSPKTKYGAYFIYSMVDRFYGFHHPVKVSIRLENEVEGGDATNAYLNPRMWNYYKLTDSMVDFQSRERICGWRLRLRLENSSMAAKLMIMARWRCA
ncbi:F-box protein PP2-B10-like isoform X2 [Juglans microcarpa x Juglans regia]|uniref:F-box protein PP2-B10-like isoform X2 n=1 Tax=Juglans microcarpa x Juglans regia TaxID=2249226 RepID=UPI001B7E096A|nr:F-box protein PP2-B10-like isoform X2 [Juglans microcarpa x Juglans regia]